MRPGAWFELRSKRAVVLLIGGYDGSGNYGDLMLLQAAVDLLAKLGRDDVALLPVVDLRYLEAHRGRTFQPSPGFEADRVLVYAPPGDYVIEATGRAGLVAAALPPSVQAVATYLYGGGYLNRRWADRMLLMIDAARELADVAGVVHQTSIASGLQIESAWVASLDPGERRRFGSFGLLGGRDEVSTEAAGDLAANGDATRAINTGDDAVGVIAKALDGAAPDRERRVNVHVNSGAWVTDAPDRIIEFSADTVAGLSRGLGGPVVLQPIIAYEDPRISEREQIERLVVAATARGVVERVEPLIVLVPGALQSAIATMRRGAATVATSYHAALTSLLAGVPAVLVRDNDYYAQKARGLQDDFGLADAWVPTASADAARQADEIGGLLGDPESAQALRSELERAAARVVARRKAAEETILELLRSGLAAEDSATERPEVVPVREWESVIQAAADAQERAAKFEDLAVQSGTELEALKRSTSWRLTGPLRALRRRRR
jgi:polysaccharide pyruvyl transferase WcaK-like protein